MDSRRPDRIVLQDGWIRSTLLHEAAQYEALVHPALIAHADPKRVAIISGSKGATLREVLKHHTVEEVIVIAGDDEMAVKVSKEYIPEWSDCSDIEGSASWCFNDTRASVYYEDTLAWFLGRLKDKDIAPPLDILIVDVL